MVHCLEVTVPLHPAPCIRRSLTAIFCLLFALGAGPELAAQESPDPNPGSSPAAAAPIGIPPLGPDEKPFIVGIGDVLQIDVWREPEVSVSAVTVRSDGKISVRWSRKSMSRV